MNFETFKTTILEKLHKALPETELRVDETTDSVQLQVGENKTFSLKQLYTGYEKGISIDDTVSLISKVIIFEGKETGWLRSYEAVKDHFTIALVNPKYRTLDLSDIPHKCIEDLVLVYYIKLENEGQKAIRTMVNNTMLHNYGITQEQMHSLAIKNRYDFQKMGDMFKNQGLTTNTYMGDMYVLTNRETFYGAASLFYEGALEKIEKEMKGNFIIIPSSVHELMFLRPNKNFVYDILESSIMEINEKTLRRSDYLSDHLYYYDIFDHKLHSATKEKFC